MSDFEINKGVGREVEFKGLRAQYLFIFAFGLLAVFRGVRHHVHGGHRAMDVYRLRGIGCHGSGLADLFAEPAFRQPRTDEAPCRPAASQENPLTQTYHTSD